MNGLYALLTNKIILSLISALILTFLIKTAVNLVRIRKLDIMQSLTGGGMPSSHSSFVSALTASIFLEQGFNALFFVSLVFSLIVLRDSYGVRRDAGRHAAILNILIRDKKLSKKSGIEKLRVNIGHTTLEVFCGAVAGVLISVAVWFFL